MSREYAEQRIKEALKLAKGNTTKARQHIIAWTNDDSRLLQALAKPHLTGIVAHAINRVVYLQEHEEEQVEIPETPQSLNMEPQTFGQEILKALQSPTTARFGRDAGATSGKRQASQSHIDALKKMAGKTKKDKE